MKPKKIDYSKTQFLEEDHGTHKTLKAYRRKAACMLIDGKGKPFRVITWEDWCALKRDWPDQVKADGLTIKTVWTLVPVTL